MAKSVNLRWGSPKDGLETVEFAITAPESIEESVAGEQDLRYESDAALVNAANGQAYVILRRLALDDEALATQDNWNAANLLEFVRTSVVPEGKVRVKRPRIKPVKADKPRSEMSKAEMAALLDRLVASGALDEQAAA